MAKAHLISAFRFLFLPFLIFAFFSYGYALTDSASLPADSVKTLEPMTVRGRKISPDRFDVGEKEKLTGRTDDLNELLFFTPGVARIPGAGSLLLVHGESTFDNVCFIRGIPVFAPSHFSGSSVADRSIVPMATPNEIRFYTKDYSGVYTQYSGSVLTIEPGILRSQYRYPYPELGIQYGSLGADFSLSIPMRRGKDYYQITWRPSDDYTLWWYNNRNTEGSLDAPGSYSDVQLLGEQRIKTAKTQQLLWLSRDTYAFINTGATWYDFNRVHIPWGVTSFSVTDSSRLINTYLAGISHTYSKKVFGHGPAYIERYVEKTTGVSNINASFSAADVHFDTRIRIEGSDWNGTLSVDTLPGNHSSYTWAILPRRTVVSGRNACGAVSISGRPDFTAVPMGIDATAGIYYPGYSFFIDPGVWAAFSFGPFDMRLSLGWISGQPDVRGLPDRSMQKRLSRTYAVYATLLAFQTRYLDIGAEFFGKIKDRVPLLSANPLTPVWDGTRHGSLYACGTDIQATVRLGSAATFAISQMLTQSKVKESDKLSSYEWEIPWLTKGSLAVNIVDTTVRAYLLGYASAGMLYRELFLSDSGLSYAGELKTMKPARRIDLKFELRHPLQYHRHLKQYEAWMMIINPVDGIAGLFGAPRLMVNEREYWWNAEMEKIPIRTGNPALHIGLRIVLKG